MLIIYILFLLCIVVCIAMILWPSIFTAFTVKYYLSVLRMFGYKIEIMPIAPGKPEKIMKIWGVISALLFVLMLLLLLLLLLVYFLPKS